MRDPRRAYRVVDAFEDEICDFTGAPYCVTVDSATNAIALSLTYERLTSGHEVVELPTRTYVGVLQAARNAGYTVQWSSEPWTDHYALLPTNVHDSARWFAASMWSVWSNWQGALVALSFHAAKMLPLGRGGAILTDDKDAAEWLRAARMDGRPPGAPIEATIQPGFHCPMPPDTAARGLWILSRWNDAGYDPPPLPPETYADLSVLA